MLRYLRLYGYFMRFSVSRSLEFRFDFFFRVVMDAVFYAVHLAFFQVLYGHVGEIGGWTVDQGMIFVAAYLLVDAIHMTFFSNNTWMLPNLVNSGGLDYYLVRPVSTLFFAGLRDFAVNSFLNLLMAAGILAWAVGRYPEPLGALNVAAFVAFLVCGALIMFSLLVSSMLSIFWTHSSSGLRTVWYAASEIGERPHMIYPFWLRRFFFTIFPVALISSYPTFILFEGVTVGRCLHMVGALAVLFAVMLFGWTRGLRAYASASS